MISLLLFIYAIYKYENERDRVTFYLILQFLALNAYALLSWSNGPIRNDDLALMLVLYSFIRGGYKYKLPTLLAVAVWSYLAWVLSSAMVSYFYYQIPPIQIFKAVRTSLFVLAVYDMIGMSRRNFKELFHKTFIISSIASLWYCYTVLSGHIPISADAGIGFLGLPRSFAFPPLIAFNCLYVVHLYNKDKSSYYPLLILSFLTLLLIQSRGMIIAVVFVLVMSVLVKGRSSNKVIAFAFFAFLAIAIVNSLIFSGETGNKTMNDVGKIASGEVVQENFERESGATLSYRLNMLVVCVDKTVVNPIRTLFGSGLIVEMPLDFFKEWRMDDNVRHSINDYTFFTPDISYPNIIYNIGIVGFLIYLWYIFNLFVPLYHSARIGKRYELVGAMFLLYSLVIAFDGSSLTWPNTLVVPMLFLQYSYLKTNKRQRITQRFKRLWLLYT